MKEFLDILENIIVHVFDNEEEFLQKFVTDFDDFDIELQNFYMAHSHCYAIIIVNYNELNTKCLDTNDIMDWYEQSSKGQ